MDTLILRIGRTNTRAAVVTDSGDIETLFFDADECLPTAVALDADDQLVVGRAALGILRREPDRATRWFLDGEAQVVSLGGMMFPVSDVLEALVGVVREVGTREHGSCPKACLPIIDARLLTGWRAAIREAVVAAGFEVLPPLTTGRAILAAAKLPETARRALVVRVGGAGGSLGIWQLTRGWEQITDVGDDQIGGRDIDAALANLAIHEAIDSGHSFADTPAWRAQLLSEAENTKRSLVSGGRVRWIVSGVSPEFCLELFPDQLHSIAATPRERLRGLANDTMARAGFTAAEFDAVILAGGGSHLPGMDTALPGTPMHPSMHEVMGGAAALLQEFRAARGEPPPPPPEPVPESEPEPELAEIEFASSLRPLGDKTPPEESPAPQSLKIRPPPSPATAADQPPIEEPPKLPILKLKAAPASTPPPEAEPAPEEKPPYLDEDVQFTVYRPHVVVPEAWYSLLAFAHVSEWSERVAEDPMVEVKRQAEAVLGEAIANYRDTTQESTHAVPEEGELTMVPWIDGVTFNPPRQSFLWVEPVHRVEFRLRAPASLLDSTARGRLTVYLGSIILAEVPLSIRVARQLPAGKANQATSQARGYRRIFASYSHKDLGIVEEFERYARAFGDRYLRDWIDLRSGQRWNDQLEQMIVEADVFQLFWSHNAMRSPYVQHEFEFARQLEREGFIRPVFWEQPLPADAGAGLPPRWLQELHFEPILGAAQATHAPEPAAGATDLSEVAEDRRGSGPDNEEPEFDMDGLQPCLMAEEEAPCPSPMPDPMPLPQASYSPRRGLPAWAIGVLVGLVLLVLLLAGLAAWLLFLR